MTTSRLNLDTTSQTYVLFLDMLEVAETHNLVQRVCQATKHPLNPILPLGDMHEWDANRCCPWESRSVIWDDEDKLFKLWYGGRGANHDPAFAHATSWVATGYAVSTDGIHWEKPDLGLYEFNGNKHNNICTYGIGCFVKDIKDPNPACRYKAIVKGYPWDLMFRPMYSPDGIHWTDGQPLQRKDNHPETACDPVALYIDEDDDPSRRFKYVWQEKRKNVKWGPPRVRVKCIAAGPDVEIPGIANLPHDDDSHLILSPNDSTEQENHFLALARYRNHYLMPYEYGWYAPNGTGVFGSYCADIRLAHSRDARSFSRLVPSDKLIPRGPKGHWDDGMLVIGDKIIVKEDTIYLFYAGQGDDFTSWPGENSPQGYPLHLSAGWLRLSRMGLATLRLDGFTCMESFDQETPGHLTTHPLTVKNPSQSRLLVNVANTIPRRSWLAVEILDPATNLPLPSYSREDCRPLDTDSVRLPVQWKTQKTLAAIPLPQIRLRFHLCGQAQLHAFTFASP